MITDLAKLSLLHNQPFFSSWPVSVLEMLSLDLYSENFKRDEAIVEQGDLVDSVYFIAEGKAEVQYRNENGDVSIVAILGEGEAIGLDSVRLYSTTGTRTATVVALDDMSVYKLKLTDMDQVLKIHPEFKIDFRQTVEQLLKVNLIKQAAPFSHLTPDVVQKLAEQILLITLNPNQALFNEGDEADFCYIICSGEIAIERMNTSDNSIQHIATLQNPQILGETALLMAAKRNATARALTKCQLYGLPKKVFLEFVKEQTKSALSITGIMLERAHPKCNKSIIEKESNLKTGEKLLTLKNPENLAYVQLSGYAIEIWKLISTNHTVHETLQIVNQQYSVLTVKDFIDAFLPLTEDGFITLTGIQSENENSDQSKWIVGVEKIKQLMEMSYCFNGADAWLTKTYQKGIKYLFSKLAIKFYLVVGTLGLLCFAFLTPKIAIDNRLGTALMIAYLINIISVILHELTHAYMTKAYGREVPNIGVGWYWIGPIAFVDTTDMWLASRHERLAVDIAGNFANFFIAGVFAILAWFISDPFYALICWLIGLTNYIIIYMNLDIILEYDGYYLLSDYLEKPNLREDATYWLIKKLPACFADPKLFKQYKAEITYWIICIISVLARVLIIVFLSKTLFKSYLPDSFLWVLAAIIILFSFVTIWVDIKQRINNYL